jgi:hypothetical protein
MAVYVPLFHSTHGSAMVGHHDRMGLRDDAAFAFVECVAPLGRMPRPGAGKDRRRRLALLLRGELTLQHIDRGRRTPSAP